MESVKIMIDRAMQKAKEGSEHRAKLYRFDIFKGVEGSGGKVQKIRTVGSAQLMEGSKTYTVYLKTLLKDVFFLLPEQKKLTRGDYVILTREPSHNPSRKFYWNNVGECFVMGGENTGLMKLSFDLFGANDLYMSLHPIKRDESTEVVSEAA